MGIHDATSVEVWFEEMHNAQLGRSRYVHQSLLVFDLGVNAMLTVTQ